MVGSLVNAAGHEGLVGGLNFVLVRQRLFY